MMILDKYKNKKLSELSNQEFLLSQIWQLKNVFFDELSLIKNTDLEYVAFSTPYAEEFQQDETLLGKRSLVNVNEKLNNDMLEKEQQALKERKLFDLIHQFKLGRETKLFMMRYRPLINPATDDCVGLIVFAIKMEVMSQRRMIIKHFLGLSGDYVIPEESLSEKQQQVITCLLLGFQQRKEIADVLGKVTDKKYNEGQIKTLLEGLYRKFRCSSFSELMNVITLNSADSVPLSGINVADEIYSVDDKDNYNDK